MASVITGVRGPLRPRMTGFYASSVAGALFFGVILFGVPELLVTWFVADPDGHRIHQISNGITRGFLLTGALLVQLRAAPARVAVAQQAVIVGALLFGALLIGAVGTLGSQPGRLVPALFTIVLIGIPTWLHPARADLLQRGTPSWPMLAVAALGGLGAAFYAAGQLPLQFTLSDGHSRILHYSSSAATPLAIAAVALLASLRTTGWRIPAWMAAIAAILYGMAGMFFPVASSSLSESGGAAAIILGIAFIALAEREARDSRRVGVRQ